MSRTDPIPREQRMRRMAPAARHAQLLRCAITVFARVGLGEARHAEIAREAGTSVPTVFNYFPSRDALVNAVLNEVGRYILDDVLKPLQESDEPAPQVLINTALGWANAVQQQPDYARIWLAWSTALRDNVGRSYLAFQEQVFVILRPTFHRGQNEGSLPASLDIDDALRLLVGSAHMIAQMQFNGLPAARVKHFIEFMIEGIIFRPDTHLLVR